MEKANNLNSPNGSNTFSRNLNIAVTHGIKSKQAKPTILKLIKYEDLLLTQELEPSHHPVYAMNKLYTLTQ